MKRNHLAAILIGAALMLAIGAFGLLSEIPEETSVHRATVKPPSDDIPTAPSWVQKGQEAEPDYSATNTDAQNATPVPEAKAPETKIIEVREDKIVTFTFVESLADFILHRFNPKNEKGKPATLASAKALNMYYGRELDGFSVSGDDIRASRKAILDYAFTPTMLKTLYELYAPVLMAHIVDTAASDEREYKVNGLTERRILENGEIKSMLRLNARKIDQTAIVFNAIATNPTITELAGKYLRAAKAVERANLQLQTAIADEKDTSKASQRLKQAIIQRERVKVDTIKQLKQACHACTEAELFYLAQWAYRRTLNGSEEKLETFGVAAEILQDLAKQFRAVADEIKE